MECADQLLGVCLIHATGQPGEGFFGFAEFVGAFALLAIVFTIADVQYRFRISVSPIPLRKLTFWLIGIIGFGTLAMDLWVAERWLVVSVPHMTYGVVQSVFAAAFILIAMAWIYFAFLNPPKFSKWNARAYGQALFSFLLRGSDSELPVIATELARSADDLVAAYTTNRQKFSVQRQQEERGEKVKINAGNYAVDILSMIGNRKFCRHVVAASPGTAIVLFQAAVKRKAYDLPMGQFAKNVSTEAFANTDSNLYHESDRYQSGLFGQLKPFSQAIYGCYELVEGLGRYAASPLDIDYSTIRKWTSQQWEAYSRAVLATYADRLQKKHGNDHSYAIHRAMGNFERACWDVYQLDGIEDGDEDIANRVRACVDFVRELIELLENTEVEVTVARMKPAERTIQRDAYDRVAELMLEIIYNVAGITKPWWQCWDLQHNTVWSGFFERREGSETQTIIAFKLRRLIYDEIVEFDKYQEHKSFKAARYLGICLNCMGIKVYDRKSDPLSAPLQRVVVAWVKKNFRVLHEGHPTVAAACLMGGISYDAEKNRLVRTYASHADRAPNQDFLALD